METEKLVINAAGKELLLGSHFHVLRDETVAEFQTGQIMDFVRFILDYDNAGHSVFCHENGASLYSDEVTKHSHPVAVCRLQDSEVLTSLAGMNGKAQELSEFVSFLESFKRFGGQDVLELLSSARHFKLKKVLSVQVERDRRGNFSYHVGLEGQGNDDFSPPEVIVLDVPIFKNIPQTVQLKFEVHFDVIHGEEPKMKFTLNDHFFQDVVFEAKKNFIDTCLSELKTSVFWGAKIIHAQDDGWRFRKNGLDR